MSKSDQLTRVVRILRGGQITIPAAFRKELGIDDETLLRLSVEDGELRVSPVRIVDKEETDWLDALYDAYAPVRAGILARGISEGEVNADIDTAIAEVRAERLSTRA